MTHNKKPAGDWNLAAGELSPLLSCTIGCYLPSARRGSRMMMAICPPSKIPISFWIDNDFIDTSRNCFKICWN